MHRTGFIAGVALALLLGALKPAQAQTPTAAIGPIVDIVGEWSEIGRAHV